MSEMKAPYEISLSQDVRESLVAGSPIVALESTIISHGFPWPDNLALANRLEETVREMGATPATIAVLDGVPTVGLDASQLERLARNDGILKCSTRDLSVACASGASGATTVAATCHLSALAGVEVFATGGIGGVHRGAERSFDVSADLGQLARSPVVVVSAGAKAILDLALTLEVLETYGVLTVGYGCDEMPAFYTRGSGHTLPHRVDTVRALARVVLAHRGLGVPGGVLVCNPIPEADALDREEVEGWIAAALEMAQEDAITGKALTPFLLATLADLSGGKTLPANKALALNNARLAAKLAVEMKRQGRQTA